MDTARATGKTTQKTAIQGPKPTPIILSQAFFVLVTFLLASAVGLGAWGCTDGQEQIEWRAALESIDSSDTQLFSFSYTSAPPEGSMFHIAVIDPRDVAGLDDDANAECSLFDATGEKPSHPDFWYLKITTSSTAPGSYTIVPNIDEHAPFQAAVRLIRIRNWTRKEATFDALGGTVTLKEAPQNLEEWRTAMNLKATVDAQFPSAPSRALVCHGEGPTDGSGEYVRTCTCEDTDGNQSTCVREYGQDDCCFAVDGERFTYHLEVEADPCSSMCRATDPILFEQHCEALR